MPHHNSLAQAISAYFNTIPIQYLSDALPAGRGILLAVLREDAIHEQVSGNKLRKLKYNLLAASEQDKKYLLTFGGAYSNHIAATAAAGKLFGFATIGIIRGDELDAQTNATLLQAKKDGMQLVFVSRAEYKQRNEVDYLQAIQNDFPGAYLIPEGGSNALGVKGCTEILNAKTDNFSHIALACGTGASMAGIVQSLNQTQVALGFSALKGNFMEQAVRGFLPRDSKLVNQQFHVFEQFHRGAYAKIDEDLIAFIRQFWQQHNILLDPIYTGKAMMALYQLINEDYFPQGSKILFIHTGGLQGWKGFSTAYRSLF